MKPSRSRRVLTSIMLAAAMTVSQLCIAHAEESRIITVKIDGSVASRTHTEQNADTAMIPLRDVCTALGAEDIYYEPEYRAVTLTYEDKTIRIEENRSICYVNDIEKDMGGAAYINRDGLFVVPYTFVPAVFDMETGYDRTMYVVDINTQKRAQEDTSIEGQTITAAADAYVRGGSYGDDNYGYEPELDFKGGTDSMGRKVLLKFDLSKADLSGIKAAVINLNCTTVETTDEQIPVSVYECDYGWNENEVTWNSMPELGNLITTENKTKGSCMLDISNYIVKALNEGKRQFSFVLCGSEKNPRRMVFDSREGGSAPNMLISKDEIPSFSRTLATKEGFGSGEDPYEWAQKMISDSTAPKLTSIAVANDSEKDGYEITSDGYQFKTVADSYTRALTYADTCFNDETTIECKQKVNEDTWRRAYVQFDLSKLDAEQAAGAYLKLYLASAENISPHAVTISSISGSFDANNVTWNTDPTGTLQTRALVADTKQWYMFDISACVNEALASKSKMLSLCIEDTSGIRTNFASSRSAGNGPVLVVMEPGGTPGSVAVPKSEDISPEYDIDIEFKQTVNSEAWATAATRVIESLPGYKIRNTQPELDEYGGLVSVEQEAKGRFYLTKIDGRDWIIDPLGHPLFNMGVVTIKPGETPKQTNAARRLFGSDVGWAKAISPHLKHDLGFNTCGGWSKLEYLSQVDDKDKLNMTAIVYCVTNYAASMNATVLVSGHSEFKFNNCMPVFDPDFRTWTEAYVAEQTAPYKEEKHIMGWMSDNELPTDKTMLDNYLQLDPTEPLNAYSYATAWTWMQQKTGLSNPTLNDVTDSLRKEWIAFVYDRYFKVCSEAFKKAMPDSLYMGCRFMSDGYKNEEFIAAAGTYCDIITMNYYNAWTPDDVTMQNIEKWSDGTPFLVTEWYTKGDDAGLANTSGAGWLVHTQADRGKFYQNYALKLLETKNCVGFHWFQFMDNDPTGTGNELSNIDANKGIYDSEYNEWTDLTVEMKELNYNCYDLIEYFDNRSE